MYNFLRIALLSTLLLSSLTSCRIDGNFKATSTSDVNIRLQLIDQLEELCVDLNAMTVYPSEAEYNKAIASCVFDKLSFLKIDVDGILDQIDQTGNGDSITDEIRNLLEEQNGK